MASQDTSIALVVTTTVFSTIVFLALARTLLYPVQPKTLRNPLKEGVYDKSNADKVKNLVYQPDQFPGARDVETPVTISPHVSYLDMPVLTYHFSMEVSVSTSLVLRRARRSSLSMASALHASLLLQ